MHRLLRDIASRRMTNNLLHVLRNQSGVDPAWDFDGRAIGLGAPTLHGVNLIFNGNAEYGRGVGTPPVTTRASVAGRTAVR